MKTPNAKCRSLVQSQTPFDGSNLYARKLSAYGSGVARYVVYSYGDHWPLFICCADPATSEPVWFENADKYSVSTTMHRSRAHPHTTTTLLSCEAMRQLANTGRIAQAIVMTATR